MADIISVGLNAQPFLKGAQDVAKIVQDINRKLGSVTRVAESFNEVSGVLTTKLSGVNKAGKGFSIALKSVGDSTKVVKTDFNNTIEASDKLKNELITDAQIITQKVAAEFRREFQLDDVFRNQATQVDAILKKLESTVRARLSGITAESRKEIAGGAGMAALRQRITKPALKEGPIALKATKSELADIQIAARKVATEFKKLADSERKLMAATIKENQLLAQRKKLVSDVARAAKRLAGRAATGAVAAGGALSTQQLTTLQQTQQKLQDLANTTKVPRDRFNKLFKSILLGYQELARNPAEKQLKAQLIAVASSYQKVEKEAKDAARAQKDVNRATKEGVRAFKLLSAEARVPKGAKAVDAARIRSAILDVQTQTEKLGVSGRRVTEIFRQMQRGIAPQVSATERKIVGSLKRVVTALNSAKKNTKGFSNGFLLSWQSMGRLIAIQQLHRGVALVANALREGTRAALEFGQTVARIKTIFDDASVTSDQLTASIENISSTFGIGLQDVAEGVFEAVSNQIIETTGDIELFGVTAAKLARVTGSSFEATGNLIAGLINSFQLGIGNVEVIAAQLFRAIDKGRFTIEEIAEQLGRAAPTANLLGVEMAELLGIIAELSIQGRKANTSLTLARNIMAKLLKPTESMAEFFHTMGVESGRAAIQAAGGLTELLKVMTKLPIEQLTLMFSDLRAVEGALSLIGTDENLKRLVETIDEITNAGEDFAKKAEDFFKDPFVKLQTEGKKVANFFQQEVGRSIILALGKANDAVGSFTTLLREMGTQITTSPIVQTISAATRAFISLTSSATGARGAFHALFTLIEVGINVVIARVFLAIVVGSAAAGRGIAALTTQFAILKAVGFSTGQSLGLILRSALTPANLLTAAVIGLTVAFELVQAHFRRVTAAVRRMADAVRKFAEEAIKGSLKAVTEEFEEIKDAANEAITATTDFFAKMQRVSKTARSELQEANKEFQNLLKEQFKSALKDFEEQVRNRSRALKTIGREIEKIRERLVKINEEAIQASFRRDEQIITIGINLLRNERKRLEQVSKELGKAIEGSEKRITGILKSEVERKFDFAQSFRSAERQFEALSRKAEEFEEQAKLAIAFDKPEEATKAFAEAQNIIDEIEQRLRTSIEEAKSAAKTAQETEVTGDTVAEKIKSRDKLRQIARNALKEEGDLTKILIQFETQRRNLVEQQIAAERKLQAIKRREQEEAKRRIEDLRKAEQKFATQSEELVQEQFQRLERLAITAPDRAEQVRFRKEQAALIAQAETRQLSALGQAKQVGDLDLAKSIQEKLAALEIQRFAVLAERIHLEEEGIKTLQDKETNLSATRAGEIRQLERARLIVAEIGKVSLVNKDGTIRDLKEIERKLLALSDTFKELTGAEFISEFGQQLNIDKVIEGGIAKFEEMRVKVAELDISGLVEPLKDLGIEATNIDEIVTKLNVRLTQTATLLRKAEASSAQIAQQFVAAKRDQELALLALQEQLTGEKGLDPSTLGQIFGGDRDKQALLEFKNFVEGTTTTLTEFNRDIAAQSKVMRTFGTDISKSFSEIGTKLTQAFEDGGDVSEKTFKEMLANFDKLKDIAVRVDVATAGTDTAALEEKLKLAREALEAQFKASKAEIQRKITVEEAKIELTRLEDLKKAVLERVELDATKLKHQQDLNKELGVELSLRAQLREAALAAGLEVRPQDFDARKTPAPAAQTNQPQETNNITTIDRIEFNITETQDPKITGNEVIDQLNRLSRVGTNRLQGVT